MNFNDNSIIINEKFFIEDLIYIPVGNYQVMFNRPYMVNATEDAINIISDRIEDTKSGKITPNIINGTNIIQPSSVGYPTLINRDWVSTKKYLFLLKVKTIDCTGLEINSYIQGYTEYDGITNNGNIDINLVHFINNIIETTAMIINTPLGIIRKEKLYRIYNIFFNSGFNEVYTQRPSDILENINLLNMQQFINDPNMSINFMGNYINSIDKKTISSSVDNNITTQYLSKILTTGLLDLKNKDLFINSYEITDDITPESKLIEPSISENRFIKYINRLAGYTTVREFFNFQTLLNIDNSIYGRFKVLNITKNYVDPTLSQTPEVGDFWHGQDPVTVKAYSLIENSVALATKYGFSKIFFIATNKNATGIAEVFITNFNSFLNLEEVEFNYLLEIFKEKFITEIFLSETNSGIVPMYVEVYIDLLGTSKVYLSFAGYPDNWYTIPTFANSHFAPVVTIDRNAMDYTTFQINSVIESLNSTFNQNKTYY